MNIRMLVQTTRNIGPGDNAQGFEAGRIYSIPDEVAEQMIAAGEAEVYPEAQAPSLESETAE